MSDPGTPVSVAQILLDLRDEVASAKAERRQVLAALEGARLKELDRAFASLRKAEDFERETVQHYRQRLGKIEARQKWILWLSVAGAALGALVGALLLVWALTVYGAKNERFCGLLGGQLGADQRGLACLFWSPASK